MWVGGAIKVEIYKLYWSCHQFKIGCYKIAHIYHSNHKEKKICTNYTKEHDKKSKHTDTKQHH